MKKISLISLFFIVTALLIVAQTGTTGDLNWSHNIQVTSSSGGDVVFPVANATVTAVAITTATAVTDSQGKCHIEVIAQDTGSVTITVTAANQPTVTRTYPGLYSSDTIYITLVEPVSPAGVALYPATQTIAAGAAFTSEIRVYSGNNKVAAYGFTLNWDVPPEGALISVDTSIGLNGAEAGADGFLNAANAATAGKLVVSGFDVEGKGPILNMHMLTIHWLAGSRSGSTYVSLTINTLVNEQYLTISTPNGVGAAITVITLLMGDANSDGSITIVDALMAAQYSVGLSVPQFNPAAADVNKDGNITIVDALKIAQYTVGLITAF